MAFIDWKAEYSVGQVDLDHDHWRLSEIINKLHDAVDQQRGDAVVGATLRSLRRYVEVHFAREERLLEQCGVKNAKDHILSHRRIEDTLADFENLHARSPQNLDSQSLLAFLRRWLLNHVLKDDMQYRPFFEAFSSPRESVSEKG